MTVAADAAGALVAAVKRQYEAFPYPHYPLLARPLWQDGYLASSLFARTLTHDLGHASTNAGLVLIGGAGEVLPYVMRRWEPAAHGMVCVDLSKASLTRARIRCAASPKPTKFVHADLEEYLRDRGEEREAFGHADLYGVLHHMPNPSRTLGLLARHMAPAGTVRVMVYNSTARHWITHVQFLLSHLGMTAETAADVAPARAFVQTLATHRPGLARHLAAIGPGTVASDARFVDTFLHAREARLSLATWFAAFAAAGFKVTGMVDRYTELDDLPNPLWEPPSVEQLEERAEDGRFEGNLEVYLRVDAPPDVAEKRVRPFLLPYFLRRPPRAWFAYKETNDIPQALRYELWLGFLRWTLRGDRGRLSPRIERDVTKVALARLARVGAILPGQIVDAGLRKQLVLPLESHMEVPAVNRGAPVDEATAAWIRQMLVERGRFSDRRMQTMVQRVRGL